MATQRPIKHTNLPNSLQEELTYKPVKRVIPISVQREPMDSLPRHSRPGTEHIDTRQKSREEVARAALDSRAGRTLTDQEWVVTKARMLGFVGLLRTWDRKTSALQLDKIQFPCPQEQ